MRDYEMELDSEKRNHAETIKILRKKERTVKEIVIQCEEDQKNVIMLQEQLDKAVAKLNAYKRQLSEVVIILERLFLNSIILNTLCYFTGGILQSISYPSTSFPTRIGSC